MNSLELQEKYIGFFVSQGHAEISGKSLVPENDPTVLFTTAGMHPLVPYIQGKPHPAGKRLVNIQRCVRTGDVDMVGDDSHLTFFEMLGNWSLGDYFKKESIEMSYRFLTDNKYLGLNPANIAVTVFAGDDTTDGDDASERAWQALGLGGGLYRCTKEDNWWGPAGKTGPCGPDTEMFLGMSGDRSFPDGYTELWNNVFMEYSKIEDGSLLPLETPCVDTGMGLERTLMILQGKSSVYECDRIAPLYQSVWHDFPTISREDANTVRLVRIITDHVRAACFMIADGVHCSNLGQGYVLRRLIRRAVRSLVRLGDESGNLHRFIDVLLGIHSRDNLQLRTKKDEIESVLIDETAQFKKTLHKGEREFEKILSSVGNEGIISGKDAFRLYDTYGFPVELTQELARERGLTLDQAGFEIAFTEHRERSKTVGGGVFKSGLQDNTRETTALHTATHLLHQSLRTVLGSHVQQKGSNITPERLRFDFSHHAKLEPEELKRVEALVNEAIEAQLPVTSTTMTVKEAKEDGALAFFNNVYDEIVSVYSIGTLSKEVCAGPHVSNTSELGKFRIQKEQSSSKGVRRIKAVLE